MNLKFVVSNFQITFKDIKIRWEVPAILVVITIALLLIYLSQKSARYWSDQGIPKFPRDMSGLFSNIINKEPQHKFDKIIYESMEEDKNELCGTSFLQNHELFVSDIENSSWSKISNTLETIGVFSSKKVIPISTNHFSTWRMRNGSNFGPK